MQDWSLSPSSLLGQTCEKGNDPCASLVEKSNGETTVSTIEFSAIGARDLRVDFCGKFVDDMMNGAKCLALINGAQADPGDVRMDTLDTDYTACMSWFGITKGSGNGNDTDIVEVQCRAEAGMDDEITITHFTTSVLVQ